MYDVAIIGGGPAGASAAIFTAKANKQTLLFDHEDGATQYAWVRNHYGIEDIDGPDLVDVGQHQAEKFGAKVVKVRVTNVTSISNGFKLETSAGIFEAHHVLFATGEEIKLADKIGLKTQPATDPDGGAVIAVDSSGRTDRSGVWASGTAVGVSPHTIISAGDGAKVAVQIISEINGRPYVDHDVATV